MSSNLSIKLFSPCPASGPGTIALPCRDGRRERLVPATRDGEPERDAAAGVAVPLVGAEANGVAERERERDVGGDGRCPDMGGGAGARPSISA